MENIKDRIIIHPFFAAFFPLLALYLRNSDVVPFSEVLPNLVIVALLLVILWWVANKLVKDIKKSALIVSVTFLLFFAFGQVLPALASTLLRFTGIDIRSFVYTNIGARWTVLLVIWMVLIGVIAYLTYKSESDLSKITQFMNVAAIALAAMMMFQAFRTYQHYENLRSESSLVGDFQSEIESNAEVDQGGLPTSELPDIYYIIVDGYARSDILEEYYDYDNKSFLSYLDDTGFYVADESLANYSMTLLSLSSSMNLKYLDDLPVAKDSLNHVPAVSLIQDNWVMDFLQNQGYRTTTFATGYPSTEIQDADQFIIPPFNLTGYQNELIKTTPLCIPMLKLQYDIHRDRILYALDHLHEATAPDSPSFVFLHVMAPHPPFVFGADGEALYMDRLFDLGDGSQYMGEGGEYVRYYRDQVIYLNLKLKAAIENILTQATRPTIIVVQGDHGPGSMMDGLSVENTNLDERMSILNAYYFPGEDYQQLYPQITPVNTFRVILDQFLGTSLGHIEDRVHFSLWERPYDYIDVTDEVVPQTVTRGQ
jgi:hypothetical protein